jgi:hypothetical protein
VANIRKAQYIIAMTRGDRAMPRRLPTAVLLAAMLGGFVLTPGATASAQQRVIRVAGDDGQPVAFANVTLTGERPRITDERGEVEIGISARGPLAVEVRRLGFEPWFGTLSFGDTVLRAQVTLRRISRRLFAVKVTDSVRNVPSYLRGFYERLLARQRGIGSGVYLTPEEVERHNVAVASALLQGLNGVSLQRTATGKTIAMSSSGTCQMTVLIDGRRACPDAGCGGLPQAPSASDASNASPRRGRAIVVPPPPKDDQFVLLDNLVGASEIAAVEVYPRGASIPPSLPTNDASCGLIAFWTGGRKTP